MTTDSTDNMSRSRYSPISGVVFARMLKDYWAVTALAAALLTSFHWLFVTFLPAYDMRYRLTYIRRLPPIIKGMIGQDLIEIISTTSLGSFAYLHPVTLAVMIGYAILLPSGMIVGQIDRGTIELVLSAPLSRKKFMFTTIAGGWIGGAILIAAALLGTWLGVRYTELNQPYHMQRIALCAVNLYAVYLLAFALSCLFSTVTRIRSYAVGWAFGLSMSAYLLHFLAEWWTWVQKIAFVGPLHYYRPIKIAAGRHDPTYDILVVIAAAVVFQMISMICFSRRDIAVV